MGRRQASDLMVDGLEKEQAVEIHVLDGAVRLLQPAAGGFRTSLDSVMLAAACLARAGDRVLDMGCGVGGASFCLMKRVDGVLLTGVDVQSEYIDLARKNADLNGARDANFVGEDIRKFKVFSALARFDHVICNPPYFEAGAHTPSPDVAKAAALGHEDEDISVTTWTDCAFELLQSGGTLTMIHQAAMADRLVQGLGKRFGAVEIIPLWPRAGVAAKRVILRARKDRRSPAAILPGLVLHEADGRYTAAADDILRKGAPLFPAG